MNRSLILAVGIVALTFLSGVGVGFALSEVRQGADRPHRAGHGGPPRPPQERFFEVLTEQLDLDAEQRQHISRVLDRAQERARRIMEESRPHLDAAQKQTRDEVMAVLNDAQKQRYLELEARARSSQRPPRPPHHKEPAVGDGEEKRASPR